MEAMLADQNLSEFFEDIDQFDTIKESLRQSYEDLTEIKTIAEEQKTSLEDKQSSEVEFEKASRT